MSQRHPSTMASEAPAVARIAFLGMAGVGGEPALVRLLEEKAEVEVIRLEQPEGLLDQFGSQDSLSLAVVDCASAGYESLELLAVANQMRYALPLVALSDARAKDPPWVSKARVVLPIARPRDDRWLAGTLTEMCHEVELCPDRWQAQVLVDYLALAHFTAASAELELSLEGLDERLYLALGGGRIHSAVLHELEGRQAVAAAADRAVTSVLVRGRTVHHPGPQSELDPPRGTDREAPSPTSSSTYDEAMSLGLSAAMRADYQKAEAFFRRALQERPDDRRARFNLDRILKR